MLDSLLQKYKKDCEKCGCEDVKIGFLGYQGEYFLVLRCENCGHEWKPKIKSEVKNG